MEGGNNIMTNIKLFESKKIRSQWYFSVVDIIGVLTDSPNPRNYWKVLKHRLTKEGNQSVTNCNQLKMESADGKLYLIDVADTEQLLRLIQSIPSPKAEPFKQWLAKVGYERIEESENPELSFDRAMQNYMHLLVPNVPSRRDPLGLGTNSAEAPLHYLSRSEFAPCRCSQ